MSSIGRWWNRNLWGDYTDLPDYHVSESDREDRQAFYLLFALLLAVGGVIGSGLLAIVLWACGVFA